MRLSAYQEHIIDDAVAASHAKYRDDKQLLDGFLAGLEGCRNIDRDNLASLLIAANTAVHAAVIQYHRDLRECLGFRGAVEWVCECMSAIYEGLDIEPIIQPTDHAYAKVATLLARNGAKVAVVDQLPRVH